MAGGGAVLSNGVGVNPGGNLVCWDSWVSCTMGLHRNGVWIE